VVTKMSAERIGHLVRNIEHLPLITDHQGLVSYEHSQDSRYTSVVDKLETMAAQAPEVLRSRAGFGFFGGVVQACKPPRPISE
jgi:hypothetical protein